MEGGKGHQRKGLWTAEEDRILKEHIILHGSGRWNRVAKLTGLKRHGKSCRLRWMNYLNPTIKHGDFSDQEDDLIIRLHNLLGNRWSLIARRIPGRTDNQVKNHWNTNLSKKLGVKNVKSSSLRAYLVEKTNSSEPVNNNGDQKIGENGSGSSIRSFDSIDPVASASGENLFWFSNDEIALNTDGLTGLFDQYCSDFIWNQF